MANNDKTFDKIIAKFVAPSKKVSGEYADEFIDRIVKKTPYPPGFNPGSGKKKNHVYGNLKEGWQSRGVDKNGGIIYNDVEYANYVDKGFDIGANMKGAHMVSKTLNESPIITKIAWKKAKRK